MVYLFKNEEKHKLQCPQRATGLLKGVESKGEAEWAALRPPFPLVSMRTASLYLSFTRVPIRILTKRLQ